MPGDDFLESEEFKRVVEEYYPTTLRDRETRWRAYQERLRPYAQAAAQVVQAVRVRILTPLREEHPGRLVGRLDPEAPLTKSPRSIDDKIYRFLSGRRVAGEAITEATKQGFRENRTDPEYFPRWFFADHPKVMSDLARFRVVCNFLSDVKEVQDRVVKRVLEQDGIFVHGQIEDRIIEDRWAEGASGHRAVHLPLSVKVGGQEIVVEGQIMTMLEEAWDQKSHLFYEQSRQGLSEDIPKDAQLKIRAMSDMLYVADELFNATHRQVFERGGTP
jgi:hypothetical protein